MRSKAVIMITLGGLAYLSFINGVFTQPAGLNIGDKVPEINSYHLDGSKFSMDSLRGKMVLIDFWASYDGASRVDNFRKKNLLEQYQNSDFVNATGFVIVSVSLDRFRSPLKQSIQRDQLEQFLHLCDFKGRESELAHTFAVENELTSYLVDGNGRIVARGSGLEKIESTLERLEQLDPSRLASNRNRY